MVCYREFDHGTGTARDRPPQPLVGHQVESRRDNYDLVDLALADQLLRRPGLGEGCETFDELTPDVYVRCFRVLPESPTVDVGEGQGGGFATWQVGYPAGEPHLCEFHAVAYGVDSHLLKKQVTPVDIDDAQGFVRLRRLTAELGLLFEATSDLYEGRFRFTQGSLL